MKTAHLVQDVRRVMRRYFATELTTAQARRLFEAEDALQKEIEVSGGAGDTFVRDWLIGAFTRKILKMRSEWPINATPRQTADRFFRTYAARCRKLGIRLR